MKVDKLKGKIIDRIYSKKDTEPITASNLGGNYHSNVQNLKKLSDEGQLIAIEVPTTNAKDANTVYFKAGLNQNPRLRFLYEENGKVVIVYAFDGPGTVTSISVRVPCCEGTLDKKIMGFFNPTNRCLNCCETTLDKKLRF